MGVKSSKGDQLEHVKSEGFDSIEEWDFNEWLKEAVEAGSVKEFKHHPEPFLLSEKVTVPVMKQLKTKAKMVDKFLLHPHSYTADFKIVFDLGKTAQLGLDVDDVYGKPAEEGARQVFVDVKGGFSLYHDSKQFSINQKWVMSKYGVYINKIVPDQWFRRTWVPKFCRITWKTGKVRDKYASSRTLETMLNK